VILSFTAQCCVRCGAQQQCAILSIINTTGMLDQGWIIDKWAKIPCLLVDKKGERRKRERREASQRRTRKRRVKEDTVIGLGLDYVTKSYCAEYAYELNN